MSGPILISNSLMVDRISIRSGIARIGKLMRLARLAKLRTIVPRVEAKLKDLGNHLSRQNTRESPRRRLYARKSSYA